MTSPLVVLAVLAAVVAPAAAAAKPKPLPKPPSGAGWNCALLDMPTRIQWSEYDG